VKGLCARDIISTNVVLVQAESRLNDVLAKIGNIRATHALVYDGERFCGVVPLNATTVIHSQRIFADLLPRVSPLLIPDSTPMEAIVPMFHNSGGGVVGVVSDNGIFTGIISQEGLLHALLDDARDRLEEVSSLNEKQEKFRIIGLMASGIAHDLNNILTAVLINLELLDLKEFSSADEKELLHIALTATRDAANAVHGMQNYYCSNGVAEATTIFDLSTIASEVKQFTQSKWHSEARKNGKTVEVGLDLSTVSPVRGNPGEIREVLTNLVINAIDAIEGNGTIRMQVYEKNNLVFVDVTDSGQGMDDAQQLHCFEPLYTTKAATGRGAGLGLAMCRNIMSKHGGHIGFETVAGKGTTFSIYLPSVPADDRSIPII
jgi:signal transduction histidine kinase